MHRLSFLIAALAGCLLLAACGSPAPGTSTPTQTRTAAATAGATKTKAPTRTAAPLPSSAQQCQTADLYGAFVTSQNVAHAVYYQLGLSNVGEIECFLVSPPEVHVMDAAGNDLGIDVSLGTDCATGGPYDPNVCVDEDAIDLPTGAETPGASPGQVGVIISVAQASSLATCAAPAVQAHSVGLSFAGTTDNISITLPADIAVLTCPGIGQVKLHGFGPSTPVS